MVHAPYGIPQGFIHFGSVAHRILLLVYEHGKVSQRSLKEDLPDQDDRSLAANLTRLVRHKFLFKVYKEKPSFGRSYTIYALQPSHTKLPSKLSGAERTRLYRQRKAVCVSSVFNFRGTIQL